jgi:3-oxoadipate enol-lactonase
VYIVARMLNTPTRSIVAVEGGELVATGGGPLLVHGTCPAIWGDVSGVMYDRRGFGTARAGEARSLSQHADDAIAVLRAAGGPRPVVGWSIGGVIALEVAAREPDLVTRLVLLEPPLHAKRHPSAAMIAAVLGATVRGRLGRDEAAGRRFLSWALGPDLSRVPGALLARDGRAIWRELSLGTGEHLDAAVLAPVSAPVRVLCGDRSRAEFAAAARRVRALVPAAEIVTVPGAGHLPGDLLRGVLGELLAG